jgi:hypothetical protein
MKTDPQNKCPQNEVMETFQQSQFQQDRVALGNLSEKLEDAYETATDPEIKAELWDEWMDACHSSFMLEILGEDSEEPV